MNYGARESRKGRLKRAREREENKEIGKEVNRGKGGGRENDDISPAYMYNVFFIDDNTYEAPTKFSSRGPQSGPSKLGFTVCIQVARTVLVEIRPRHAVTQWQLHWDSSYTITGAQSAYT
eukprot:1329714-Amorphochlora_amoeboformis.AAC.1